jgi:hypothetical protein
MTQLVFIHGRAQEHKDAAALKAEWIDAWKAGLNRSGLDMPVDATEIRFPFYGNTLFDLANGKTAGEAAAVIVKGAAEATMEAQEFMLTVLQEVQDRAGISDAVVANDSGQRVVHKGVLNWNWVQNVLVAIDRHVPGASGASIVLGTNDVFQYIDNVGIRDEIESGVRQAMQAEVPTVVVSHSLGTVVAYNLLRREGADRGWKVPLLVTVGSPLAVSALRKRLAPNRHPSCVGSWFNAFDTRDVVALYPLDAKNFPLDPAITNYQNVRNETPNRHGISGYLSDPQVAKTIYAALTK